MSKPRARRAVVTRARHLAGQAAIGVLIAQFTAASALTLAGMWRRRHHLPRRFPTSHPVPVTVGADTVTVHTFGRDLYADMLEAIDAAQHTVHLETFIWKGDEVGQQFKDAVIRASRRGVDVRLIVDEFANLVVPRRFFDFPSGVNFRWHPLFSTFAFLDPRNGGRDHRKLLIVDTDVAFLGGYNIGTVYADQWRDTHARFTGPVVAEIENAFIDHWNTMPVSLWRRHDPAEELELTARREWSNTFRFHRNTPSLAVYPIRNMYLEAIDRAARSIHLTHAYFIPDAAFLSALFSAAKRGVDVRIIIPAESNHVLADWLSRGFYEELLRDGVRIFLYQGAMVHAKTGTIDGEWSTIGTANLDRMSLLGNYEINAEITSPAVAERMEEIFDLDLENSVELTLDEWRKRSAVAKGTEALLAPWRMLF